MVARIACAAAPRTVPARRLAALLIAVAAALAALCSTAHAAPATAVAAQVGPAPGAGVAAQGLAAPAAETRLERAVEGLPQRGPWLGRPDAPVVIELYADLQCPYCRQFSQQTLPRLVRDHVATGAVRLRYRFVTWFGRDSVRMARLAVAAGEQGRLWQTTAQLLLNQGQEQSGYATDDFLRAIAQRVRGLDAETALAASRADASVDPLRATRRSARLLGVDGVPGLAIGRRGGPLRRFTGNPTRARELAAAIETARRG